MRNALSSDKLNFQDALSSFDPLFWNLVALLMASLSEMSILS